MVYSGMKRGREGEFSSIISIADWMMLLSHTPGIDSPSDSPSRVFECKTCNRQFSSFQALGGHRASHKKQRLVETELTQFSPPKPKTHECAICGLEFTVGQALGGHMRRHRVAESTESTRCPLPLKKDNNNGEFLCLDLNLTPKENGMDFQLEKVAPEVICFL